ncbi:uncharacterized protein [Penaeus vannamei]|uniref:uncharacterized protein n=1 Tax=Penaeus vannamei TaxID=6689 RepID=UPI00387FB07D
MKGTEEEEGEKKERKKKIRKGRKREGWRGREKEEEKGEEKDQEPRKERSRKEEKRIKAEMKEKNTEEEEGNRMNRRIGKRKRKDEMKRANNETKKQLKERKMNLLRNKKMEEAKEREDMPGKNYTREGENKEKNKKGKEREEKEKVDRNWENRLGCERSEEEIRETKKEERDSDKKNEKGEEKLIDIYEELEEREKRKEKGRKEIKKQDDSRTMMEEGGKEMVRKGEEKINEKTNRIKRRDRERNKIENIYDIISEKESRDKETNRREGEQDKIEKTSRKETTDERKDKKENGDETNRKEKRIERKNEEENREAETIRQESEDERKNGRENSRSLNGDKNGKNGQDGKRHHRFPQHNTRSRGIIALRSGVGGSKIPSRICINEVVRVTVNDSETGKRREIGGSGRNVNKDGSSIIHEHGRITSGGRGTAGITDELGSGRLTDKRGDDRMAENEGYGSRIKEEYQREMKDVKKQNKGSEEKDEREVKRLLMELTKDVETRERMICEELEEEELEAIKKAMHEVIKRKKRRKRGTDMKRRHENVTGNIAGAREENKRGNGRTKDTNGEMAETRGERTETKRTMNKSERAEKRDGMRKRENERINTSDRKLPKGLYNSPGFHAAKSLQELSALRSFQKPQREQRQRRGSGLSSGGSQTRPQTRPPREQQGARRAESSGGSQIRPPREQQGVRRAETPSRRRRKGRKPRARRGTAPEGQPRSSRGWEGSPEVYPTPADRSARENPSVLPSSGFPGVFASPSLSRSSSLPRSSGKVQIQGVDRTDRQKQRNNKIENDIMDQTNERKRKAKRRRKEERKGQGKQAEKEEREAKEEKQEDRHSELIYRSGAAARNGFVPEDEADYKHHVTKGGSPDEGVGGATARPPFTNPRSGLISQDKNLLSLVHSFGRNDENAELFLALRTEYENNKLFLRIKGEKAFPEKYKGEGKGGLASGPHDGDPFALLPGPDDSTNGRITNSESEKNHLKTGGAEAGRRSPYYSSITRGAPENYPPAQTRNNYPHMKKYVPVVPNEHTRVDFKSHRTSASGDNERGLMTQNKEQSPFLDNALSPSLPVEPERVKHKREDQERGKEREKKDKTLPRGVNSGRRRAGVVSAPPRQKGAGDGHSARASSASNDDHAQLSRDNDPGIMSGKRAFHDAEFKGLRGDLGEQGEIRRIAPRITGRRSSAGATRAAEIRRSYGSQDEIPGRFHLPGGNYSEGYEGRVIPVSDSMKMDDYFQGLPKSLRKQPRTFKSMLEKSQNYSNPGIRTRHWELENFRRHYSKNPKNTRNSSIFGSDGPAVEMSPDALFRKFLFSFQNVHDSKDSGLRNNQNPLSNYSIFQDNGPEPKPDQPIHDNPSSGLQDNQPDPKKTRNNRSLNEDNQGKASRSQRENGKPRGTGKSGREISKSDRGTGKSGREISKSDRGTGKSGREISKSDRGTGKSGREISKSDRDTGKSSREAVLIGKDFVGLQRDPPNLQRQKQNPARSQPNYDLENRPSNPESANLFTQSGTSNPPDILTNRHQIHALMTPERGPALPPKGAPADPLPKSRPASQKDEASGDNARPVKTAGHRQKKAVVRPVKASEERGSLSDVQSGVPSAGLTFFDLVWSSDPPLPLPDTLRDQPSSVTLFSDPFHHNLTLSVEPPAPLISSRDLSSTSSATLTSKAPSRVVPILGLFDLTARPDQHLGGRSELAAAQLALKHINDKGVIPGHELVLFTNDTHCDSGKGVDAFFHAIYTSKARIMFLLGAACPEVTESLASVVPYWNIVQVSFGSVSPALSDRQTFPRFIRTVAPDSSHNAARLAFLTRHAWSTVATISEDHDMYTLALNELVPALESANISLQATVTLSSEDLTEHLHTLKEKDCRIFIASFSPELARKVFCQVEKKRRDCLANQNAEHNAHCKSKEKLPLAGNL